MKLIALFSVLFLISVESVAQRNSDQLYYAQKVEKYRRLKNTGTSLTVAGVVLEVVCISMISNLSKSNSNQTVSSTSTAVVQAELVYYLGVGCLGAGIPLWIVGSHAQHKYERKFENLSVGFNFTPQNKGLTLSYRF